MFVAIKKLFNAARVCSIVKVSKDRVYFLKLCDLSCLGQEIAAPPPPPDVAQCHLFERLGLLLPKQPLPAEGTLTTGSSIGGSSGFSSFANGDYQSDVGSVSPGPAHGRYTLSLLLCVYKYLRSCYRAIIRPYQRCFCSTWRN